MSYENKRIAGLLVFAGAAQFVLAIVISEAVYSGYSVGQQYISELGDWSKAGNSALIWNASVILLGLLVIAGAYFLQRELKNRLFTSILAIGGVSWVGVGMVSLNTFRLLHVSFGWIGIGFWWASVIMSYRFEKSPFSYVSLILGAMIPLATILLGSGFLLGLGLGGMQRFIIYPLLLWLLGFGAYLIGDSSDTAIIRKA